jgi:hypothetical protein
MDENWGNPHDETETSICPKSEMKAIIYGEVRRGRQKLHPAFRFPSDSGMFIPKKTCCLSNNKGNIQKLIMMADWFRNNRLINLPDWLLTYVIDEKIRLTNTPGISI